MPIIFAAISPHPPLLLPDVGTDQDKIKVKNTIQALDILGKKFSDSNPDRIIISSPHTDWGFDVPLFFIARKFSEQEKGTGKYKIEYLLAAMEKPKTYFEKGMEVAGNLDKTKKYALIASGDMSHCLKEDGPYGIHPDGKKFDEKFIEALKTKDIETILKLDEFFPSAAECGLQSFCFLLGVLQGAKIDSAAKNPSGVNWQPEILSYEAPFGVGYLVADFKISG